MFETLAAIVYLFFAIRISLSDINLRVIRNKDLVAFLVLTIILNFKILNHNSIWQITVVTVILIVIHLIFRRQIGAGDLKLFWVLSFWSHSSTTWLQYFSLAWVLGGIFSAVIMLTNRRFHGGIPFAPFIFLGFLAVVAP